jgi:hypothetical protein
MSEIDLIHLTAEEWREILTAAAELDLVRGGYFRLRPDAIQFFCSPENAPEDWTRGYPEGSPELPRAAVGQAEVVRNEGENAYGDADVTVRLIVSNWAAMRAVKRAYDTGEYRGRYEHWRVPRTVRAVPDGPGVRAAGTRRGPRMAAPPVPAAPGPRVGLAPRRNLRRRGRVIRSEERNA